VLLERFMNNSIPRFPRDTNKALLGFGARLRRLRRAHGIKQAYVAQLAGVDQATVSRWERGEIKPDYLHAQSVLRALSPNQSDDSTLRRLVESSSLTIHLIRDVDHTLLAASLSRIAEWNRPVKTLIGKSVWEAASPAIYAAEASLEKLGWWEYPQPAPVEVNLEPYDSGFLPIVPGKMLWERVWLSDGCPARLCTLLQRQPKI